MTTTGEEVESPTCRTNKSGQLVDEVRSRFLASYQKYKNDDIYSEEDLSLIVDDWYIKRFLLAANRDVEETFNRLDMTMKLRHQHSISAIRDYHFPSEFYLMGGLFIYELDKGGTITMFMRIRMHRKVPELEEPIKGFLVHTINKADIMAKRQGFGMIFDLTGVGYSNVDLSFLSFLINTVRSHFPYAVSYIIVYNLPWIVAGLQKVVYAMLPEGATNLIKFAYGKDIFNYIDPSNVPDYLEGGLCRRNYRKIAPGSRPILDVMTHYGYGRDVYDRVYPTFQRDLEETAQALQDKEYDDPPPGYFDDFKEGDWCPFPLPSRRHLMKTSLPAKKRSATFDVNGNEVDIEPALAKRMKKMKRTKTELMTIFPPDLVSFVFDGKAYVAEVDLANKTNQLVAYKILSNKAINYSVTSFKGILLPRSAIRVTITFSGHSSLLTMPSTKDKFLFLSSVVATDKMSAKELNLLWKNADNEVCSRKMLSRIAFVMSDHDSTDSGTSLPDQLRMVDRQLRQLEANYTRLWLLFCLLLILTVALWVAILAHFNGSDMFSCLNYDVLDIVNSMSSKLSHLASLLPSPLVTFSSFKSLSGKPVNPD